MDGDVGVGSTIAGVVAVAVGDGVEVGAVVGSGSLPPPQAKPTMAITAIPKYKNHCFFIFPPEWILLITSICLHW